ncbi:acyl-CoA dehydrogenase family protein [Mangrovicella endophytica]|uniref:acyl-CoA dehydrogenase family protein n=1 Tax=Mangrovicella endophytica TaxID=2066697 RepID=UPI000C9E1A43|nr:acyl-CoA dehydrogenase family protein [Mangrovicella endophytica]
MRHERPGHGSDAALIALLDAEGAECDRDGAFPERAFAALRSRGLLAQLPLAPGENHRLLRLLAMIGRGDLSTGRIFEGHVNACLLIDSYGSADQRETYRRIAREGGILGVWNTDLPDDPLRLDDGRLQGRKSFASGVDGLSHALVTVPSAEGRMMIIVPLAGLPVDRAWWQPMGMRASGSHVVDFSGLQIEPDWIIGKPDDYIRQPWFSAGAARFAAVQVGGMHAVLDIAVRHLAGTGRAKDPYQAHRLARMGIAVETVYLWLERSARSWAAAAEGTAQGAAAIATANATRCAVEAAALSVLEEAERGVGAAGLIQPHPLERRMRDLRTYLRQPNPDGALAGLGAAIADGLWAPGGDDARPSVAVDDVPSR